MHHIRRYVSGTATDRKELFRKTLQTGGSFRFRLPMLNWFEYPSYVPDSDFIFGLHPEFSSLRRAWLKGNRANNAGDLARMLTLVLNLKQLGNEAIVGDFAELGVYKGNSAAILAHFARAQNRSLFLFDTFAGFDERDLTGPDAKMPKRFSDTSIEGVRQLVGETRVTYCRGYFPESLTAESRAAVYAFVHVDCDLYMPMHEALIFFYPRLVPGGMLFLHDYSSGLWPGVKQAVDEFCTTIPEQVILLPDKSGTAIVRKSR